VIIDAWMQHPNADWIKNPIFDSLRRWRSDTWSEMNGAFQLSIRQGIAMGRPSEIEAEATKCLGEVGSVSVAGPTAFVAQGVIEIPSEFLA
jgi:hypothetical protein